MNFLIIKKTTANPSCGRIHLIGNNSSILIVKYNEAYVEHSIADCTGCYNGTAKGVASAVSLGVHLVVVGAVGAVVLNLDHGDCDW